MSNSPIPTEIKLNKKARMLELTFDGGEKFELSCEYLRINSPSAEVQGHGPGEGVLQVGKENVGIDAIEAVGSYAVLLRFDDGHDTGIYAWDTLYNLGANHEAIWKDYLEKLAAAGHKRREPTKL
ncbi:MAG: DUF971 domain-containing protein [Sulfuriflexus sp.]|nr:DUF971 domain-containing protein [Sulfuriflexus sp.]